MGRIVLPPGRYDLTPKAQLDGINLRIWNSSRPNLQIFKVKGDGTGVFRIEEQDDEQELSDRPIDDEEGESDAYKECSRVKRFVYLVFAKDIIIPHKRLLALLKYSPGPNPRYFLIS